MLTTFMGDEMKVRMTLTSVSRRAADPSLSGTSKESRMVSSWTNNNISATATLCFLVCTGYGLSFPLSLCPILHEKHIAQSANLEKLPATLDARTNVNTASRFIFNFFFLSFLQATTRDLVIHIFVFIVSTNGSH